MQTGVDSGVVQMLIVEEWLIRGKERQDLEHKLTQQMEMVEALRPQEQLMVVIMQVEEEEVREEMLQQGIMGKMVLVMEGHTHQEDWLEVLQAVLI